MIATELWTELELEQSQSVGLTVRRCPMSVIPDVFLGIEFPYNHRCLALSLPVDSLPSLEFLPQFREIQLEIADVGALPGQRFFVIKLTAAELSDVFGILCEDLIGSVAEFSDASAVVAEVTKRLNLWSELFQQAVSAGLSGEAQAGLFGELHFIRMALDLHVEQQLLLSAWTGPSQNIRDFQYRNCALEVKSTRGNNHQLIFVSSERQLDPSLLDHLFLFHVSLEILPNGGETLNDLVDSITYVLTADARTKFKSLLISAGYFDHHRTSYESDGYAVRGTTLFDVREDFPRIEEKDLRSGVGNVKYSILTAGCDDYRIELDHALEKMNLL